MSDRSAPQPSVPSDPRFVTANGIRFGYLEIGSGPRLALLLHGFPDEAGSMVPLASRLAAAGYRCAMPWIRGYAPTEAPRDGNYQLDEAARDTIALVEALGHRDALLVGHDWGAAMAWTAAAQSPTSFSHAVGIAVPPLSVLAANVRRYPRQLRRSWYMGLFQLGALGPSVLRRDDFALVDRLWRDWSPGWTAPPERLEAVKRMFRQQGVATAAVGWYRGLAADSLRHRTEYRRGWRAAFTPIAVPSLAISGVDDGCIATEMFDGCERAFAGRSRLLRVPGAGHFVHLERTDAVADAILDFCR